ncbi:MAG TPA: 4Fe-4S binding protein [Candidatus Hydrogenedentes bacterium]|nr:4Fe-4S binding protein [Candidatus Hydrogenedentota bacterium]
MKDERARSFRFISAFRLRPSAFVLAVCALLFASAAPAQYRFPMPEFSSGYQRPDTFAPKGRLTSPVVDMALLAGGMALTAWMAIKRRSRRGVLMMAVFSVVYFGFYRQGCVCPVGSIQNVLNAFMGGHVPVPLLVSLFFLLPLIFAIYFGRVFCAAVCPLGAIQEICAVKPVQIPMAVEMALGMFAYAYLGLAVLGVATGAGFLICRFDPFIGFYRQGGSFNMLLAGGLLLLAGVFIARPYCRFLCPYGVLLRWASLYSRWHASITPAECIQCRLCEDSCPYNAIRMPTPEDRPENRRVGAQRLARLLLIAPVVVAFAAYVGFASHRFMARIHPTVWLAERVAAVERGEADDSPIDTEAFRSGRESPAELYAHAETVRQRFKAGSALFGGFMGLALCGRLIRLSVIRTTNDYEPDRAACVSCARCFAYCPVEKKDAAN